MDDAVPSDKFDAFSMIDFDEDADVPPVKEPASPPAEGKHRRRKEMPEKAANRVFRWSARIAAGFVLLIIGFAAGHFANIDKTTSARQVNPDIQKMQAALVNTFGESRPS